MRGVVGAEERVEVACRIILQMKKNVDHVVEIWIF
jgi:hypothetical protein